MAMITYDKIVKYNIYAICTGPLHIGGTLGEQEEVLVHPTDGKPFIQATGIAGAFRNYYEQLFGIDKANRLFGASYANSDNGSRIIFTDGIFNQDTVKIEIRPHVKINRKTGSVSDEKSSGQKFDMEYVGVGAMFKTSIYMYIDSKSDDSYEDDIKKLFNAMYNEGIVFGAKKSSGAGKIKVTNLFCKTFEMTNASDRKLWADETIKYDNNDDYEDITSGLTIVQNKNVKYHITVTGKTEGAILVKGIAISHFGKDAPDSENIKNAQGKYIIPGSSVRGTIRSQMEKIAAYLNKDSVIEDAFGKMGEKHEDSCMGNLVFSDVVIDDGGLDAKRRARIHIDKFTGGVINRGLFQEQNTAGELVDFVIDIQDRKNADGTLGLLVFALRDLLIKTINLGGGYATGKGFINIDEIGIQTLNNRAVITSAGVVDDTGIINKAIKALQEVEA